MRRTSSRNAGWLALSLGWLISLHSLAAGQAPSLDSVLKKMDATAANFQTAEADFVFNVYHRVVDETDTDKGTVYYRRSGSQIEMMAQFSDPAKRFVLYKDGKLQIYQPNSGELKEYSTGENHQEFESFLVLGFGGSGEDLKKSFDVTYQGEETIANIPTAKLQLIPKSEKVRGNFPEIILWIDLSRGVSVQQKLMQMSGDYRLAKYSAIRVNTKINNDVFRLKTSGKTKVTSP
ncbi:MAG: outer membrane lipoprotein carrier protein LolA [Candidatus Sulfotelmatobacter sp.]